ncbi:hypothetical protein BEWA_026670 [Theileria equi strain WA]|uniref:Uncharacterized protein n=1 Tax=Theileria equi strain WA TaxID=1537102 RepID=L0AX40_THEEQ|nr:hypothetical protein BEWA_026670 [Theileria equi strain WA]AFZ79818.1 hypothetical protein BEWA_026670 [Theileria equi strain WA]|eukprot:XP_004829484.1 hypothetical protein BEWA_026670 [Theileria equi strain WA]
MGNSNGVLVSVDVGIHPGTGGRAVTNNKGVYTYTYKDRTITISEERRDTLPGYKAIKHQKTVGESCSLYQGATEFHGFVDLKSYGDIYAYFWQGDDDYKVPLVIQLGDADNYYISDVNSTTWRRAYGITFRTLKNDTLKNLLDRENCKKNRAHVMEISKGKEGPYKCSLPTCDKEIVEVSFNKPLPYAHSVKVMGSSITRFENENKSQKGLPFPKKVNYVYVYFDLQKCEMPLLICIDPLNMENKWQGYTGCKWYQRDKVDTNAWIQVNNKPTSPNDSTRILEILKEYLPNILSKIEHVQRAEKSSNLETTPVINPDFTLDIAHLPHLKFKDPEEILDIPGYSYPLDYRDIYPSSIPDERSSGGKIVTQTDVILDIPELYETSAEDPVFPMDTTLGSVTPYESWTENFEVVLCDRSSPDHKVTVDFGPSDSFEVF